MRYVGINSSGGGNDKGVSGNGIIEKDYTLELSKKIKDILDETDVETILIRDNDNTVDYDTRIKTIEDRLPKGSVVLSNTLSSSEGIEIIYALKSDDTLASTLASSLETINSVKYYQYRWPTDSTKDYYLITRNTPDYQTIIIRYGNPSNSNDALILKNKMNEIANNVADVLINYLGAKKSDINYYVVKSGDTLWSIAKKFNMTVDELKSKNNLTSNLITINQKLKVNDSIKYIVKKGDTLYSIAKIYNTSVDKIKNKNNLKSDFLSIGTVLYIP